MENQKTVLITGTSTGIGRACATHLDKLGFTVFAGVRKKEDGDILGKECRDLNKKFNKRMERSEDGQED